MDRPLHCKYCAAEGRIEPLTKEDFFWRKNPRYTNMQRSAYCRRHMVAYTRQRRHKRAAAEGRTIRRYKSRAAAET